LTRGKCSADRLSDQRRKLPTDAAVREMKILARSVAMADGLRGMAAKDRSSHRETAAEIAPADTDASHHHWGRRRVKRRMILASVNLPLWVLAVWKRVYYSAFSPIPDSSAKTSLISAT
jgi:predicted DNA-binding helix-hairpin-helix protein